MTNYTPQEKIMGIIRISLGWIFLWPFFDKLLGLGFATPAENAWINGGSPTYGFLTHGTRGPLAEFFQSIAGHPVVDWLFMIGLLCIGVALMLGIFIKIAAFFGAVLLFLMWLAVLPPEHNPFLDDHIIYGLMLIALMIVPCDYLGFGRKWRATPFVTNYSIFE
jgi:thiosulfate dehydrogenase [quinone] large subunit